MSIKGKDNRCVEILILVNILYFNSFVQTYSNIMAKV